MVGVSIGVLVRDGRVLLCQRAADAKYALKWEFPGGKLEIGESFEEALTRELHEELNIKPRNAVHVHTISHYNPPGRQFQLRAFIVPDFVGEIENRIFKEVQWVHPERLLEFDILQANIKFCTQVPKILVDRGFVEPKKTLRLPSVGL